MDVEKIICAERIGQHSLLISLSDGTDILLTLDQLLSIGGPRFMIPKEDEGVHAGQAQLRSPLLAMRRLFRRDGGVAFRSDSGGGDMPVNDAQRIIV